MTVKENTLQQLAAFGFTASELALADGSMFEIQAVVRTVPNKRLVCRCVWSGQPVYAKIFLGKNAARYADRDAQGVAWLSEAGIRTPTLLSVSETADSRARVLLFAEILDAMNAEQQLASLDHAQKAEFAGLLVQEVAAHHRSGLVQTDMYLKNFLIKSKQVYTLDGDGVRQLSGFFQKRQKLINLATLLSKFDVLDDGWIPALYARYCLHTGELSHAADISSLLWFVQKIRQSQVSAYADRKVFRNCTDVKVLHGIDSFKAIAAGFNQEHTDAEVLDACLSKPEQNLKNGNTCTVGFAELAGRRVVVKRYNIKGFWHGLNRAFRVSRAALSWANAHRLLMSNIATAQPLALIEMRWGLLRRRAYYLSAYVDAPDALQFFAQCGSLEQKQIAARHLATLLHKMYLLKYTHGDFKATNIKIVDLQPLLIDLDAMRAHSNRFFGFVFRHGHVKDLKRLMRNWSNDQQTQALLRQALSDEYLSAGSDASKQILIRAGIA